MPTAAAAIAPATLAPTSEERALVRALAARKHAIGSLPDQQVRQRAWRDLNGLRPCRPLVWITEIPWHELDAVEPAALRPRCRHPFLREVETALRRELFQWERFPGDMVVLPVLHCRRVGGPDGVYADYGLKPREITWPGAADVQYTPIIDGPEMLERIVRPRVWVDREETARRVRLLEEVVEGAIPVRERGLTTQWHTPWDMAVRWYGVERLMFDMLDRPELVAATCERLCRLTLEVLDEQERLGLLDVGEGAHRVGSGGYGCCDELPGADPGRPVTTRDQWGCGNAQIFSEVSARMHEEFSLRFERPVLARFGLTYYGCCEPLHRKIAMLRTIPNLRKISMSPRADLAVAAASVGRDFVLSYKPNPADLAGDACDDGFVRDHLRQALGRMQGSPCEIILKDLTTVRSDPARLQRWERTVMAVAAEAGAAAPA
jgi:hypothetical protein